MKLETPITERRGGGKAGDGGAVGRGGGSGADSLRASIIPED